MSNVYAAGLRLRQRFRGYEIALGFLLATALWITLSAVYPRYGSKQEAEHFAGSNSTDERLANYTLALAIFTGLLAISTVGLGYVTWRGIRNQSRETRILQRAYLTALLGGVDIDTNGQVLGQVIFSNAGHLPARKVSAFVKIMWSAERGLSEFDSAQNPPQSMVMPVNTKLAIGSGALASGKQRLVNGQGYIYVWGRVSYEDGFGDPKWLIYCHRYNCGSPKNARGGIDARYGRYHYHHNDGN